jgi:hypothetical protein
MVLKVVYGSMMKRGMELRDQVPDILSHNFLLMSSCKFRTIRKKRMGRFNFKMILASEPISFQVIHIHVFKFGFLFFKTTYIKLKSKLNYICFFY